MRTLIAFTSVLFLSAAVAVDSVHGQFGYVERRVQDPTFFEILLEQYVSEDLPEQLHEEVGAYLLELIVAERQKISATQRLVASTNRLAFVAGVMVHLAVVIGFAVAALEFRSAWRLRRMGVAVEHEVRLGIEGLAVKTSFYGLLILLVATTLYVVYIRFVYPIQAVP